MLLIPYISDMTTKNKPAFIKAIEKLMQEHNLSQGDLARCLGIMQSQVSHWVNGKSLPRYNALQSIVDAFDVDINTFFD